MIKERKIIGFDSQVESIPAPQGIVFFRETRVREYESLSDCRTKLILRLKQVGKGINPTLHKVKIKTEEEIIEIVDSSYKKVFYDDLNNDFVISNVCVDKSTKDRTKKQVESSKLFISWE